MDADAIPDFWADPSIDDVSVLHGDFWPEEERIEDFMAALQEWRGHGRPGRGL